MRETETPKAASGWLAERNDSPSARASATHPRIRIKVYHGFVDHSALGEDLASAVLAGVGSFVGEGLDLRGMNSILFMGGRS